MGLGWAKVGLIHGQGPWSGQAGLWGAGARPCYGLNGAGAGGPGVTMEPGPGQRQEGLAVGPSCIRLYWLTGQIAGLQDPFKVRFGF